MEKNNQNEENNNNYDNDNETVDYVDQSILSTETTKNAKKNRPQSLPFDSIMKMAGSSDSSLVDYDNAAQTPADTTNVTSIATCTALSPIAEDISNASTTVAAQMRSSGNKRNNAASRNSSIKQFKRRFRSFSNDLLRSIESAHDLVDLGNSNFATATQLAAAQHYQTAPTSTHEEILRRLGSIYDKSVLYEHKGSADGEEEYNGDDDNYNDEIDDNDYDRNRLESIEDEQEDDLEHDLEHLDDKVKNSPVSPGAKSLNDKNIPCVMHDVNNTDITENDIDLSVKNEYEIKEKNAKSPRRKQTSKPHRTIDEMNIIHDDPKYATQRIIFKNELYDETSLDENNINMNANKTNTKVNKSDAFNTSTLKKLPPNVKLRQVEPVLPPLSPPLHPPTKSAKDQIDFRIKKKHIIKNGIKKAIPDDITISILEVFIYLWGVITFFADLISDIILSIEYYKSSRTWLGSMTLTFVIVPNVTLSLFSLSWYIDKYYAEKQLKQVQQRNSSTASKSQQAFTSTCDSITFWITTICFVVFQLDLVWKYIQGFVYTLKGWAWGTLFKNLKWEKYYIKKQIKCDTDIGMLRLIDVFLDSGPQVLLQLYVITTQNLNEIGSANLVVFTFKDFQTTSVELKQLISILSSLFSMGYALAGYHRCLRNQQFIFCLETNKPLPMPMSWLSTIMQFLWYLFLIAPRVLSMAIFASTFRSWFFMIIFTHWIIMYFWILSLKTNYCITNQDKYNAREEIFEKFYNFVCSFIYIFVYFNLKAGPTFMRYLIYYIIFYSENILFCICYFLFSKETNFTYKLTMLLIVVVGFWLAITFQLIYYLYCHPSHDIRVCVNANSKFYFIHKEALKPRRYSSSVSNNVQVQPQSQLQSQSAAATAPAASSPAPLVSPSSTASSSSSSTSCSPLADPTESARLACTPRIVSTKVSSPSSLSSISSFSSSSSSLFKNSLLSLSSTTSRSSVIRLTAHEPRSSFDTLRAPIVYLSDDVSLDVYDNLTPQSNKIAHTNKRIRETSL